MRGFWLWFITAVCWVVGLPLAVLLPKNPAGLIIMGAGVLVFVIGRTIK